MSDGTPQPDRGLTPQEIRETILAGAAEGALERARRVIADATAGPDKVLDEVMAVLKALAAGTLPPPVTVAYAGLASATAVVGTPQVGTLGVGPADVAAAADELRVIGQPDVEKLAGRPPVRWSKQELILNSLFIVGGRASQLTARLVCHCEARPKSPYSDDAPIWRVSVDGRVAGRGDSVMQRTASDLPVVAENSVSIAMTSSPSLTAREAYC